MGKVTGTVTIWCNAIMCGSRVDVDVPGWSGEADVEETMYCLEKDSQLQKEWFDSVCPGCVEGYPACDFSKAFAYSGRMRTIGEKELYEIERGVCPYRTNGTFCFSVEEGLNKVDISEVAPVQSGKAVANAVRKYIEEYP